MPRISIQANSGAEMSVLTKIAQLQAKLPRTDATEMKLLRFCHRREKSMITAAEANGSNKTSHGSELLVVNIRILGW